MKHLIQQWLDNEIDNEIEIDNRILVLEYAQLRNGAQRYEVWEDNEMIAHTDNHKDFLEVGSFIGIEQSA